MTVANQTRGMALKIVMLKFNIEAQELAKLAGVHKNSVTSMRKEGNVHKSVLESVEAALAGVSPEAFKEYLQMIYGSFLST
jgi:hypothetical protein